MQAFGIGLFFSLLPRRDGPTGVAEHGAARFAGCGGTDISGCLLIGLFMPLLAERFLVNPQWRLFLTVGFLGAFTTFSTFEYETGALLRDGEWLFAGVNVVLSVIVGFVALKIGELIARAI